jgi:hypothetical protein
MTNRDLEDLYVELASRRGEHTYLGSVVFEASSTILAVDQGACPAIFMRATEHLCAPAISAASVAFVPARHYVITYEDGSREEGIFDGIVCLTAEPDDVLTFIHAIQGLLQSKSGTTPTTEDLRGYFTSLVRLFGASPPANTRSERIGLWGELFLMKVTLGFKSWLPYWRNPVNPMFDFSTANLRLEVKTTTGNERIHHFSHRQLLPERGEEIYIASIMAQESSSGLSLLELISEARESSRGLEDRMKVEQAARRARMNSRTDTGPMIDHTSALDSVMWYRAEAIPHFLDQEPAGVFDTRYRADLTYALPVGVAQLEEWLAKWPMSYPI